MLGFSMIIINLLFVFFVSLSFAAEENTFFSICYHDVAEKEDLKERDTIPLAELTKHFQWLKENGYHPISIDELIKVKKGEGKLPSRAVLLTFDDSYASFYHLVYPLLKSFKFPAVLSVVGKWIDTSDKHKISYGDSLVARDHFMTWEQLREVSKSGLVEIASHSYDHHRFIVANPQGTKQAAYMTREYFPQKGTYESLADFKKRVQEDLKKNDDLLFKKLGKRPRVMTWPYGRYNMIEHTYVQHLGTSIALTLDDTKLHNTLDQLMHVNRYYYKNDQKIADLINDINNVHPATKPLIRSIRIDLDQIHDTNPEQFQKNVDLLIERIHKYRVNTVFLQAFADVSGKGYAEELYFPNRHLPIKADIFNYICWQLFRKTRVSVYAWLPILGFDLKDEKLSVKAFDPETHKSYIDTNQYKRLSPFNPKAKAKILEIFEDLSFNAPIAGIAFHDDVLTDFEDVSDAGLKSLKKNGFPPSLAAIKEDETLYKRWVKWKTRSITDLTRQIMETVKIYRPHAKSTRSLFARQKKKKKSEAWFSQNFSDFLENYDSVALMAMPYMEQADNPEQWLLDLYDKVKLQPTGLEKTIFELQTVDWKNSNRPIDSKTILQQLRLLSAKGIRNFSLYPDNLFNNHPDISVVKEGISLQRYLDY